MPLLKSKRLHAKEKVHVHIRAQKKTHVCEAYDNQFTKAINHKLATLHVYVFNVGYA